MTNLSFLSEVVSCGEGEYREGITFRVSAQEIREGLAGLIESERARYSKYGVLLETWDELGLGGGKGYGLREQMEGERREALSRVRWCEWVSEHIDLSETYTLTESDVRTLRLVE